MRGKDTSENSADQDLIGLQDRSVEQKRVSDMSDITIKVKTEQLAGCADTAERKIRNLRNTFQKISDCVDRSRNYWTGEGNNAHVKKYMSKVEIIEQALARLDENVSDLREVAGIYVQAEAASVQSTEVLPFDVII